MSKAENVVRYYVLCNKLKDVIRTGWKNWNVKRERLESVAEHICCRAYLWGSNVSNSNTI